LGGRLEHLIGILPGQIARQRGGDRARQLLEVDEIGPGGADARDDALGAFVEAEGVEGHHREGRPGWLCRRARQPEPAIEIQAEADGEAKAEPESVLPQPGGDEHERHERREQVECEGVDEKEPPPAIAEEATADEPAAEADQVGPGKEQEQGAQGLTQRRDPTNFPYLPHNKRARSAPAVEHLAGATPMRIDQHCVHPSFFHTYARRTLPNRPVSATGPSEV